VLFLSFIWASGKSQFGRESRFGFTTYLNMIILRHENLKSWSSSLCNFFPSRLLLYNRSKIFPMIPCSQMSSAIHSSLQIRYQVSLPYKAVCKFRWCMVIFTFQIWDRKQDLEPNGGQYSLTCECSFGLLVPFLNILKLTNFPRNY